MSDNSTSSKRPFGLSFPSKPKAKSTIAPMPINRSCLAAAAFSLDDDDDDDNSNNLDPTKKNSKMQITTTSTITNRRKIDPKTQREIQDALEQDPNIYEYDEVYEQVSSTVQEEQKRDQKKRLAEESNVQRQPKYITGLLETSKAREREYERVQERRMQRELEKEGDLYADKEVFVTPAYKIKLAERQADIEREKFEEEREAILNVKQQDNMDAFYRFQFKVRTGEVTILEESEKVKSQVPEPFKKESSTNRSARQLRSRADEEDNDDKSEETNLDNMYTRAREKHARDTQREKQPAVNEEQTVVELPKPLEPKPKVKVRRVNDETSQVYDDEQIELAVSANEKKKKKEKKEDVKENEFDSSMPLAAEKKRKVAETRLERLKRLCEKRTVGDILNTAKQAYCERQQKRELYKDYIERTDS